MTAIAAPVTAPDDSPGLLAQARWAVTDTLTITRRNLLVWLRVPAYIVFTVIQPVMFVLMFRYVFGGAIPVPGIKGGYVNFLMPGIIGQTAAFATFGTAIALAQELKKGVIDRLRSMPMARSAVLAGRLVADTGRMLVTILIIVGVGYAVGFRFEYGWGPAVLMIVLAIAFGVAICCIAGLAAGLRQQPAGHLRHRRDARAGTRSARRGRPGLAPAVEEPHLADRNPDRLRAARCQGVPPGQLTPTMGS
jgi:hypothetical protein